MQTWMQNSTFPSPQTTLAQNRGFFQPHVELGLSLPCVLKRTGMSVKQHLCWLGPMPSCLSASIRCQSREGKEGRRKKVWEGQAPEEPSAQAHVQAQPSPA